MGWAETVASYLDRAVAAVVGSAVSAPLQHRITTSIAKQAPAPGDAIQASAEQAVTERVRNGFSPRLGGPSPVKAPSPLGPEPRFTDLGKLANPSRVDLSEAVELKAAQSVISALPGGAIVNKFISATFDPAAPAVALSPQQMAYIAAGGGGTESTRRLAQVEGRDASKSTDLLPGLSEDVRAEYPRIGGNSAGARALGRGTPVADGVESDSDVDPAQLAAEVVDAPAAPAPPAPAAGAPDLTGSRGGVPVQFRLPPIPPVIWNPSPTGGASLVLEQPTVNSAGQALAPPAPALPEESLVVARMAAPPPPRIAAAPAPMNRLTLEPHPSDYDDTVPLTRRPMGSSEGEEA